MKTDKINYSDKLREEVKLAVIYLSQLSSRLKLPQNSSKVLSVRDIVDNLTSAEGCIKAARDYLIFALEDKGKQAVSKMRIAEESRDINRERALAFENGYNKLLQQQTKGE